MCFYLSYLHVLLVSDLVAFLVDDEVVPVVDDVGRLVQHGVLVLSGAEFRMTRISTDLCLGVGGILPNK